MEPIGPMNLSKLPWNNVSGHPGFSEGDYHFTDSVEGDEGLKELHWIGMGSSYVDAIAWVEAADWKLWVRFKDRGAGKVVFKYNATEDQYDDMFSAASPGRFVNYVLNSLEYAQVW